MYRSCIWSTQLRIAMQRKDFERQTTSVRQTNDVILFPLEILQDIETYAYFIMQIYVYARLHRRKYSVNTGNLPKSLFWRNLRILV